MSDIKYVKGDATQPIGVGNRVIVHCCNDAGGWGSGFVLAISKRWSEPEDEYRRLHRTEGLRLGDLQLIHVDDITWVANIVGQHKYGPPTPSMGWPYVRYEALKEGFEKLASWCALNGISVHMPRIACGLAGGSWDRVEPLINETFGRLNVGVTVYDI